MKDRGKCGDRRRRHGRRPFQHSGDEVLEDLVECREHAGDVDNLTSLTRDVDDTLLDRQRIRSHWNGSRGI